MIKNGSLPMRDENDYFYAFNGHYGEYHMCAYVSAIKYKFLDVIVELWQ